VIVDADVVRANVERNRIAALTLADGRTVRAKRFVAAISPLTVLRWNPSAFPDRYRSRIEAMRLSDSLVRLSLGLDVDPRDEWDAGYEIWLMNWRDNNDQVQIRLSITAPKTLDPGCAPPGSGVLAVTTTADYEREPWSPARRESAIDRLVD